MSTAPTIDPATIKKQGLLDKMGGNVHSWKRRHFVLHGSSLSYFKSPDLKEELGVIPLNDGVLSIPANQGQPGAYFALKLPADSGAHRSEFLLKAQSDEERQEWMDAINGSIIISVFGKQLTQSLKVNPDHPGRFHTLPYFLIDAIQFIEANYLDCEGIYRLSASASLVEKHVNDINKNNRVVFTDPHAAAGTIKQYMRTMADPLFLFENYRTLQAIGSQCEEQQLMLLKSILGSLPISNFVFLLFLFTHLRKVMEHSENNKMNERALSVCIGPSLIWAGNGASSDAYSESNIQQTLCTLLLKRYDDFFGERPLMNIRRTANHDIAKVTAEPAGPDPYELNVSPGHVFQLLGQDENGWAVGVYNDGWGVIHEQAFTVDVKPKDILRDLGQQGEKWKLSPEYLCDISSKCPEALQLYDILMEKCNGLRKRARELCGIK